MTQTPHIGRNISRLRELRNMKQETLADQLGVSQQSVSRMEQNENVDDSTLEKVSKVLGFSPSAIKTFDEEKAVYNVQNNFEGSNNSGANQICNFNPLDKMMEAFEQNKNMAAENKNLYERLLASEKEKTQLLQKVLDKLDG